MYILHALRGMAKILDMHIGVNILVFRASSSSPCRGLACFPDANPSLSQVEALLHSFSEAFSNCRPHMQEAIQEGPKSPNVAPALAQVRKLVVLDPADSPVWSYCGYGQFSLELLPLRSM